MSQVKAVNVEIQIVLGRATLPMAQLLRMGRGAVIPLDASVNEEVWILANNHPIARGEIQINDDRIAIAVTREADVYDYMAGAACRSCGTALHKAARVCYAPRLTTSGRGGIGRRAALRSLWGNPWKFESSRPHQ